MVNGPSVTVRQIFEFVLFPINMALWLRGFRIQPTFALVLVVRGDLSWDINWPCGLGGLEFSKRLPLCASLEFLFQEQSYSSLHSGQSLVWDHVRGNKDNQCGTINDFCDDFSDPCGIVAIPEALGGRCGDVDHCATC